MGDGPFGVAASPDNLKVYVTHDSGVGEDFVWVIDTPTLTASLAFSLPNQGVAEPTATFHPNGSEIWIKNGCGDGCTRRVSYPSYVVLGDLPSETAGANANENHISFVPGTGFLYSAHSCGCCGHFDRSQYTPSVAFTGRRYEDGLGAARWTVAAPTGGIAYLARVTHCTTPSTVIRKESATTDSTLATLTIPGLFTQVGAISPDGGRLYLTTAMPDGTSPSVTVVDTAGMSVVATIPVGDHPFGIAISSGESPPADSYVYWTESTRNPGVESTRIMRARPDGTGMETVLEQDGSSGVFVGIAFDAENGHMYSGDRAALFWANLDGTSRGNLVAAVNNVLDVELDLVNGKVYWSEGGAGINAIYRANLDGSGRETLQNVGFGGLYTGLALDVPAGKLYFVHNVNSGADYIGVMNLDGTGVSVFRSLGSFSAEPRDVEINPVLGELYWNQVDVHSIFRAPLDGTPGYSLQVVPPNGNHNNFAFDPVTQRLYVIGGNGAVGPIQGLNLDGSDLVVVAADRAYP